MIRTRKSHFSTSEMAKLIPRVARIVRRQFRGSILGIGNVSVEGGGPIGQSVSHRSGRDVDFGMYAKDRRGRRINLKSFVRFGRDGWDRQHRYQFDTDRNLALVVALLEDTKVQVQWIFVADWLKQKLLAEAWEQGVDPIIISRMDTVLHQPGDSNPHQDHYHVRIYCSVDDRRHGCIERGPIWDWVDLGDTAYQEYVDQLIDASRVDSVTWQKRVVEHLGRIRATRAAPRLLSLISDALPPVQHAALKALRAMREPELFTSFIRRLSTLSDESHATRLLRIALQLEHPEANGVARMMLRNEGSILMTGQRPTPGMIRAGLQRLGLHGTAMDAAHMRPFLRSANKKTSKVAARAFERLTGTASPGRVSEAERAVFWEEFLAKHPAVSRAQWFVAALRAAGVRIRLMPDWQDIPSLIAALRQRNALLAHTASRLLTHITGHPVDPRARTLRNTQRAWRTFWRNLQAFTSAEPAERSIRRPLER